MIVWFLVAILVIMSLSVISLRLLLKSIQEYYSWISKNVGENVNPKILPNILKFQQQIMSRITEIMFREIFMVCVLVIIIIVWLVDK